MPSPSEMLNPFSKSGLQRMFTALQTGAKTGKELVEMYQTCKTYKQIKNLAGILNRLDGIRIRCKGLPSSENALWEMMVVNPRSILARISAATPAPAIPEPTLPKLKKVPAKIGAYIPPPDYSMVRDSLDMGDNVFLVGPSGSGKTAMAIHAAKDLKAEFIRQNFNGETTVDNLIGYNEIGIEGGVSVTTWHDGELARAARLAASGKKVVYLADEITAGKPEVLFQFHRVLERLTDGGREMEVDGMMIKIPPEMFSIVATGNSFRSDESGRFQGSNMMNEAFCNRFTGGVFFVDYPTNESEILQSNGVDQKVSEWLVRMAAQIRAKAKDDHIPVVCSTRQLISIGQKSARWGLRKAVEHIYLSGLTSDERQLVDPIILSLASSAS